MTDQPNTTPPDPFQRMRDAAAEYEATGVGLPLSHLRGLALSGQLRSIFGPLFGGEPTITCRPNGSVRVEAGECHAELSKEAADRLLEET